VFEFPREFVNCTETEMIDVEAPDTVNGMVSVNWLPVAADAGLVNHEENVVPNWTVKSLVWSVEPLAAAKRNVPLVTSRDVEYPVTITFTPPAVCWNWTPVITGGPASMVYALDYHRGGRYIASRRRSAG